MIAIYYLHLPSHFPHLYFTERINQTVEILKHTVDIEEKGVKLKLTIVDTPGFGDAVNNIQRYVFVMPMVISLQKRQACGTLFPRNRMIEGFKTQNGGYYFPQAWI